MERQSKEQEVSEGKLREAVLNLEEATEREVAPTTLVCTQGTWCRHGFGEEGFPGPCGGGGRALQPPPLPEIHPFPLSSWLPAGRGDAEHGLKGKDGRSSQPRSHILFPR